MQDFFLNLVVAIICAGGTTLDLILGIIEPNVIKLWLSNLNDNYDSSHICIHAPSDSLSISTLRTPEGMISLATNSCCTCTM